MGGDELYKVSEAAEIIGVEKVDIFEKMITHKSLLDAMIKKQDGVTYFDERAIDVLKTLFFGGQVSNSQMESNDDLGEVNEPKNDIKVVKMKSKFEKDREILYDKIEILKNELFNLDTELEMKDEMIHKYQRKMIEDMEQINKLQYTIMKQIEKQVD